MITVQVLYLGLTGQETRYAEKNDLGNVVSGENYTVSVTSHHGISKLFRICRESRAIAQRFYHICLPSRSHPTFGEAILLYLSSEFDILHIVNAGLDSEAIFFDFIHDIKAYDPRGLGVKHLAFQSHNLATLLSVGRLS